MLIIINTQYLYLYLCTFIFGNDTCLFMYTEGSHQRPTLPQALCSSIPSPCFPGVPCEDTLKGPQCGTCPQGYIGNGRSCEPMISSCASNPCFRGTAHFIIFENS